MKPLRRTFQPAIFMMPGLMCVSSWTGLAQEEVHEKKWTLDKDKVGAVPNGWRAGETSGRGNLGKWEVVKDNSAPTAPNVIALPRV